MVSRVVLSLENMHSVFQINLILWEYFSAYLKGSRAKGFRCRANLICYRLLLLFPNDRFTLSKKITRTHREEYIILSCESPFFRKFATHFAKIGGLVLGCIKADLCE